MGDKSRMEQAHRGFVVTLAHQAGVMVQVRGLDTGKAKDVSGVVRVGGEGWRGEGGEEMEEWLYFLKGEGVEVFRRGEMRG